ncbi:hypothetical protein CLIB1423_01S03114 [[Candida] railenensis]|uniref:Uncharacterized protein n=1 Tax=[Candida] railenensis TaxID=45579 RepID=A0A9P0VVB4_9ASCO|nr:hypothetical protein CLIB1423_01S03114 [[Candida] railenensis]
MFSRSLKSGVSAVRKYSTDASAHSVKETEINVPKIFGIAALFGASIWLYKNTNGDQPAIKTQYFDTFEKRRNVREEIKLDLDEKANGRNNIFLPGKQQHASNNEFKPNLNYNIIPAHSPWGVQFGQGIKTDKLGPRREQPVKFAPAQSS